MNNNRKRIARSCRPNSVRDGQRLSCARNAKYERPSDANGEKDRERKSERTKKSLKCFRAYAISRSMRLKNSAYSFSIRFTSKGKQEKSTRKRN